MRRRLPLLSIAAAYIALTVSYSLVTPLNEGPDEIWHYLYVRHIAEGKGLPIQDPEGYGELIAQHEAGQPAPDAAASGGGKLSGIVRGKGVRTLVTLVVLGAIAYGSYSTISTPRGRQTFDRFSAGSWKLLAGTSSEINSQIEKQISEYVLTSTPTLTRIPTATIEPTGTRTPRPSPTMPPTRSAATPFAGVPIPEPSEGSAVPATLVPQAEDFAAAMEQVEEYFWALNDKDYRNALTYWLPERRNNAQALHQVVEKRGDHYSVKLLLAEPMPTSQRLLEVTVTLDIGDDAGTIYTDVKQI